MVHSLEFFSKHSKGDVLEHSLNHLRIVREAVYALCDAIKNIDNREMMMEFVRLVAHKEHEADEIRRQLTLEIVKGNVVFLDYEELLEFVYGADSIADWAHTADRYLALFKGSYSAEVAEQLMILAETACKCVDKLYNVVENMRTLSKEEILAGCAEIESLEENADDVKRDLLNSIFAANYSPVELILLRDLAEAVEDICDRCEDSADTIRLLAVEIK